MQDLEVIYKAIKQKAAVYEKRRAYYDGDQPTVYLTERLRELFRGVDVRFTENWCAVVIDACAERINLTGWDVKDARAAAILKDAWERNYLNIESSDIHVDSLVMSECYAIAWPGADNKAEVYYNSPSLVHVIYSDQNPRQMKYAGKMFDGGDGKARMTLYYPDHLEYYIAERKLSELSAYTSFQPDMSEYAEGRAPNPYGVVPVFHFRINRYGKSDLESVIPLQNGTNKLLADMMVAAEYGAFMQRYVISNGDTSSLRNAPNEIWNIPAGDGVGQPTSVGQFSATDLKNYLDAIDRISQAIGVISRTPKHYFFSQGGDPSGEALIAMEAPLNKKAQDRIDRFYPVWRDLAAFICKIEGVTVDPFTIEPAFDAPETVQPMTRATITKTRVESGVPLVSALRWEGRSDAEIEQMQKDQDEESQKNKASLGAALLEAERQARQAQDAQNTNGNNNQNNQQQGVTNDQTQNT